MDLFRRWFRPKLLQFLTPHVLGRSRCIVFPGGNRTSISRGEICYRSREFSSFLFWEILNQRCQPSLLLQNSCVQVSHVRTIPLVAAVFLLVYISPPKSRLPNPPILCTFDPFAYLANAASRKLLPKKNALSAAGPIP